MVSALNLYSPGLSLITVVEIAKMYGFWNSKYVTGFAKRVLYMHLILQL